MKMIVSKIVCKTFGLHVDCLVFYYGSNNLASYFIETSITLELFES